MSYMITYQPFKLFLIKRVILLNFSMQCSVLEYFQIATFSKTFKCLCTSGQTPVAILLNRATGTNYSANSSIFNHLSLCKHPADDQRAGLDESRGVTRAPYCSQTRSGGGLAVTSCHLPAWEPVISLIMWLS